MLRIGITGGIGSGKSIAGRLFHALGVPVYDADSRARWLMENDTALRQQLTDAFGPATYDLAGRLNRPVLASTVFSNPEAGSYKQLDRIITVFAPLAVRQARVLQRDPHRSTTDVQAIMAKQLSEVEKVQRADYVLTNDDVQPLLPQVLALHAAFRALQRA